MSTHAKLSTQRFILQLLSVTDGGAMPVSALVQAGRMFDITPNNLRVTLARLLARGLVARNERGTYRLAPAATPVQSHVAAWKHLEDRMVRWQGGWIGVHTASLSRANRASLRGRVRALDLLGFRELHPDLHVRPDNLTGGVADVRRRLYELGLERDALVFALADLDEASDARARALWDVAGRTAEYEEMRRRLDARAAALPSQPLHTALVEAFLLGGHALRLLAFDPLLPEAIDPGDARRALVAAMMAYDTHGRREWSRYMRERGAPEVPALLQYDTVDAAGHAPAAVGSAA